MPDPTSYVIDLQGLVRPSPFPIPETIYGNIQWFNANRATSRIFHTIDGIEGVVIHATAGGSTSGALSHWESPGVEASAHWIVPDEDELGHGSTVLAVVYEALAAWHVRNSVSSSEVGGKNRINHWTLGIEVVNRQVPSDAFSDWQVQMTALLVRYCWAKYPNLRWVFSHALVDPTRRSDPGENFDWATFSSLVLSDANDPAPSVFAQNISQAVTDFHGDVPLVNGSCCM